MESDYKKIFTGDSLAANRIVSKLHEIGIEAIAKDEAKSALLAGFASSMLGQVDIFVNVDEEERAMEVVSKSQL
jgi:putative signal transducing protein